MDRQSTGDVAARLGVSRSRVQRAVSAGLVHPSTTRGGHYRFGSEDIDVLAHRLGVVAEIPGLSREEAMVLGALARRPFGLRSARAVARAAGISPTSASRTLSRLRLRRLVRHTRQRMMQGAVSDVEVWEVNLGHRRWPTLAPRLAEVVLPDHGGDPVTRRRLPDWLRHVFWNADTRRLDLERDAAYIAHRVVASDDVQAHAWAAGALPPEAFDAAAAVRGLDPGRAQLARNLAATGRRHG